MTFSKFEFYGGSTHVELTNPGSLEYSIGYGDSTRVIYFTETNSVEFATLNLPDATKLAQTGFMFFFVANDTEIAALTIKDSTGGNITTLEPGECGAIGLQNRDTPAGEWFVDVEQCVHELPPPPAAPVVSFGGATLNNDTWLYQHVTDTWSQAADTADIAHFAQAANTKDLASGAWRSFWKHLNIHYEFSVSSDTHTIRQYSTRGNQQTGSVRLRDGNGVIFETYLNWAHEVENNKAQIYDPNTDAWSFAADLTGPDSGSLVAFGRGTTAAGEDSDFIWQAYLLIGEPVTDPDLPDWPYFWQYTGIADVHVNLQEISAFPVPPNRWQVSMVTLGRNVHVLGGSVVTSSPRIPEDASARHVVYQGNVFDAWVARPQVPDPVMGMGIEVIPEIENKFTFGMGQNIDGVTGSANHWEYDETTQTYVTRSVADWFQKNSQEGSWCIGGE